MGGEKRDTFTCYVYNHSRCFSFFYHSDFAQFHCSKVLLYYLFFFHSNLINFIDLYVILLYIKISDLDGTCSAII